MNEAQDLLSRKLDALLTGQAEAATRLDQIEDALRSVVATVAGLVPILGTHREMLQRILEAAAAEDAGGSELAEALRQVEAALSAMTDAQARTTQALSGLPEAVEEAAARGARQAMSREPAR
jgi:ABC-type transporter Mla subunit MlaD